MAREYVVQVGVNEFEIEPLDKPVSVDIICSNKTLDKVQVVYNKTTIHLDAYCTATANHYVLKSSNNYFMEGQITHKAFVLTPKDVFGYDGISDDEIKDLYKVIQELKEIHPQKPIDISAFKAAYNRKRRMVMNSLFVYRIELILGIIMFFILMIAVVYCCRLKSKTDSDGRSWWRGMMHLHNHDHHHTELPNAPTNRDYEDVPMVQTEARYSKNPAAESTMLTQQQRQRNTMTQGI